jgi:pectate lyase
LYKTAVFLKLAHSRCRGLISFSHSTDSYCFVLGNFSLFKTTLTKENFQVNTMHFLNAASLALTLIPAAHATPLQARAAAVDELVGYGAGTTGGGSGAGVTVTSCAEFTAAAKNGGVIKISGTIKNCDIVKLASNTSILGVGSNSGFENTGLRIRKISNVIVRNIKLHIPPQKKDLIDIDASTKVWIDHCDFSSAGTAGVDKDLYDGMLDAKHGSDALTFSWNNFSSLCSKLTLRSGRGL